VIDMRWAIPVLLAFAVAPAYSQENLTSVSLTKSDLIAVGTLYHDFKFPWLDGWNERGHIQVERTLKGYLGNNRNIPFAWERDFRQGWCLTRPDWRGAVGKAGIWLLRKQGDIYRAPDVFDGFLDTSRYLDQVVGLLTRADK
jgi:hypothetical protein